MLNNVQYKKNLTTNINLTIGDQQFKIWPCMMHIQESRSFKIRRHYREREKGQNEKNVERKVNKGGWGDNYSL